MEAKNAGRTSAGWPSGRCSASTGTAEPGPDLSPLQSTSTRGQEGRSRSPLNPELASSCRWISGGLVGRVEGLGSVIQGENEPGHVADAAEGPVRPSRTTVRVSSSPSRREAATLGGLRSRKRAGSRRRNSPSRADLLSKASCKHRANPLATGRDNDQWDDRGYVPIPHRLLRLDEGAAARDVPARPAGPVLLVEQLLYQRAPNQSFNVRESSSMNSSNSSKLVHGNTLP